MFVIKVDYLGSKQKANPQYMWGKYGSPLWIYLPVTASLNILLPILTKPVTKKKIND